MVSKMRNKLVKLSQRSVIQIKRLGLTEDDIANAADIDQKIHEGKGRFRIILCTKKGPLVAICAARPDHLRVITPSKQKRLPQ